jgi:GNAT superfamily N-acetyltransferase
MLRRPGGSPLIARQLAKYAADLVTLPGDLALGYRNEGFRGAWDAVAPRTLHRVFRTSRLTVFAQPLEQIPATELPPGIRITRLRAEDIPALAPIAGQRDRERFRRLLDIGCIGIAAWRGQRPVGHAWVATEMRPEVSRCRLELPSHAAYLWDLYVVPAERRNGVGSALAVERLRVARALGRTEGWRMIEPHNVASLHTLRRSAGSTRTVGEIRYLKLGSRMFSRYVPCRPPTR